jgi:putative DNA methylase
LGRVPITFGIINVWVYGMTRWGDLFNPRQKLALITFAEKVRQAHARMLDAGAEPEFAKAVVTYLALGIDRVA